MHQELVHYLQRFYSDNRVVPFDIVGVNVSRVIPEEVTVECLSREEHQSIAKSRKVGSGANELIREKVAAGVDNNKEQKYLLRLKRMRERNKCKWQKENDSARNARLKKMREKKKERLGAVNKIGTNPVLRSNLTGQKTVRGSFLQGSIELFGVNAGKQCTANGVVAVAFNTISNCFEQEWDGTKMNNILFVGNSLYSYLYSLIAKDFLFLSELPTFLY